jgi:hypothetical protein
MSKFESRIIYFIKSACPTEDERADALRYGDAVVFMNARFVPEDSGMLPCAGVAGSIPVAYANAKKAKPIEAAKAAKPAKGKEKQVEETDADAAWGTVA